MTLKGIIMGGQTTKVCFIHQSRHGKYSHGIVGGQTTKARCTHRCEHLLCLLDGGDARPVELLEELYSGGIVQRARRMRAEKRREARSVRQRGGRGPVRQLQ